MPLKSAPLTQAAIRRMIKESVDVAIAAKRARHANIRKDARGSRPVRGQDATATVRECTFAGFMKCNPTAFPGTKGAVKLLRWFKKTESVFGISECVADKKDKFVVCTIKCHKCGKVGQKIRYYKEKNVAKGANALPIPTCYDCCEQGHTRNRCPRKVNQEEVGEVRGRAYAIKDVEPKLRNAS
ncbi:reverse transcriptase domain-containing protein [Tanacetum coccineum]